MSRAHNARPNTERGWQTGATELWRFGSNNAVGPSLLQNNKMSEFALMFAIYLTDALPSSPLPSRESPLDSLATQTTAEVCRWSPANRDQQICRSAAEQLFLRSTAVLGLIRKAFREQPEPSHAVSLPYSLSVVCAVFCCWCSFGCFLLMSNFFETSTSCAGPPGPGRPVPPQNQDLQLPYKPVTCLGFRCQPFLALSHLYYMFNLATLASRKSRNNQPPNISLQESHQRQILIYVIDPITGGNMPRYCPECGISKPKLHLAAGSTPTRPNSTL